MIQLVEAFRKKISSGPVYGPFAKTSDPAFVECAGYARFDFIILDMEHGPNSIETMQNLVRAACLAGILPIVRVEEGNLSSIGKALDIGAGGVQVPKVSNAGDLRRIVEHARFAPQGMRGVCRFVRAARYSATERQRYFHEANQALIIAHLEGVEAIAELEEILKVEGLDVLFIGPYDLSQSLGMPGQVNHPAVEEKMRQIIEQCKKHEVKIGTFADTPEGAIKWVRAGVRYMSYSVDVGIFYEACRDLVNRISAT